MQFCKPAYYFNSSSTTKVNSYCLVCGNNYSNGIMAIITAYKNRSILNRVIMIVLGYQMHKDYRDHQDVVLHVHTNYWWHEWTSIHVHQTNKMEPYITFCHISQSGKIQPADLEMNMIINHWQNMFCLHCFCILDGASSHPDHIAISWIKWKMSM